MTNTQLKTALAEAIRKLPEDSGVVLLVTPISGLKAGGQIMVETATNVGPDALMSIIQMIANQPGLTRN